MAWLGARQSVAFAFAVTLMPPPSDVKCPPDTKRREASAKRGEREEWCERPDGLRDGPYRLVNADQGYGERREEGQYRRGEKQGEWRVTWGPNPPSITTFRHGIEEGPASSRYRDGSLDERWSMKRGKRTGPYEKWNSQGRLSVRTHLVNDRENGRYQEWDDAGGVCDDGMYRLGSKLGRWIECKDLGGLRGRGSYEGGLREGVWLFSLHDGTPTARGRYHRGKRDGTWTFFWDDGKTTASRGSYRRGLRQGRWTTFGRRGDRDATVDCRRGEARSGGSWEPAYLICRGKDDRERAFDPYGAEIEAALDDDEPP